MRKKEEEENKKNGKGTTSYTGGEKSGLAVENPVDDDPFKRGQMQAQQSGAPTGPVRNVTVYRNGFQVDGGPFRPITDPLNKKFMDEIAQGYAPKELQAGSTQPVNVSLHDKRGEDFKEGAGGSGGYGGSQVQAFAGTGMSLNEGASSSSGPVSLDAGAVQVNADKPKSKIQIRFHDGQRKAQEFNNDQTVGDLRKFCSDVVGGAPMKILGGFPPKPVEDDSMTLEAAGLCGAAVTVKPA